MFLFIFYLKLTQAVYEPGVDSLNLI
jgi:hypothetical protein